MDGCPAHLELGIVAQVHHGPDAAEQQLVVLVDDLVVDDGVAHAHVDQLGQKRSAWVIQSDLDLIDDPVLAALAGDGLDLFAFIGADIVAAERLPHILQARANDLGIGRGAVLPSRYSST